MADVELTETNGQSPDQEQPIMLNDTKPLVAAESSPVESKSVDGPVIHDDQLADFQVMETAPCIFARDERQLDASEIAFGFSNLCVSTEEGTPLLKNMTGFVRKGGITAVLGPSPSGKTLLMRVLSGREPGLTVTGKVNVDGRCCNPHSIDNKIGFVPQENILIGELTVRETLTYSARLRLNKSPGEINESVEHLCEELGIDHRIDEIVGTFFKKTLSGGEQRRVSVGVELIAEPKVVFLDEPTSGLDATSALQLIKTIRNLCERSKGEVSVLLSIHQPNVRILQLFDHILVLSNGNNIFFGTMAESLCYFEKCGSPVPRGETPTDHYLFVTDESFPGRTKSGNSQVNFQTRYAVSKLNDKYTKLLECCDKKEKKEANDSKDSEPGGTSWCTQFWALTQRNAQVATKDIMLYYLQFILDTFYGFLVGAFFWNLPTNIDNRLTDIPNGVTFLIFVVTYISVFKVYYLMGSNKRLRHETTNSAYTVGPFFAAEQTINTIANFLTFMPAATVGYFMTDLPASQYGFCLLMFFLCALSAEAIMSVVSLLSKDGAYAVMIGQGVMVIICIFTGGAFIRWDEIPGWWKWLENLSFYAPASRSILSYVYNELEFSCTDNISGLTNTCTFGQTTYTCDVEWVASTTCTVSGEQVLYVNKGVDTDLDIWADFGHVLGLLIAIKLVIFLLYMYPPERLSHAIKKALCSDKQNNASVADEEPSDNEASQVLASVQVEIKPKESKEDASNSSGPKLIWRDLKLSVDSGETIIGSAGGLNGEAKSGRLLGIMGPSGAGKTTMLNALSKRATYATTTGKVLFGSRIMRRDDLNFVPQFPACNPSFTVRELLTYMGKLKTNVGDRLNDRVSQVIDLLGLGPRADTLISLLSSGEIKRVSIGLGLISRPNILFLDEPTTGLDSSACHSIVEHIHSVTVATGVVCVMTIHQPSYAVFSMLDDLLLLSKGNAAYFGLASGAEDYFSKIGFPVPEGLNPADHLLDMVIIPETEEGSGKYWKDFYLESDLCYKPEDTKLVENGDAEKDGNSEDLIPNEFSRFMTLMDRSSRYYWRYPGMYGYRFYEMVVLGLFLGTMYLRLDNTTEALTEVAGGLFFSVWCVLFSAIVSTPTLVADRVAFDFEYLNGAYSLVTYSIHLLCSSIPYTLVTSVVYTCIVHFLVGFNDSGEPFIYHTLMNAALLWMMEGVALMIVQGLGNAMLSTTFSMIVLGMMFLCPGFFIKTDDMYESVKWLSHIIPTRYGLRGLLYQTFEGQDYDTGYGSFSGTDIRVGYFDQDEDESPWADFGAVVGYMLLFRVCHLGMLIWSYRKFQ